jgi:5'-nucleotidase
MFDPPLDLAKARVLVCNDDGIAAPGLRVLERIARQVSSDVWVVAPELEQSGAGHSLTLHRPLRLRQLGASASRSMVHRPIACCSPRPR